MCPTVKLYSKYLGVSTVLYYIVIYWIYSVYILYVVYSEYIHRNLQNVVLYTCTWCTVMYWSVLFQYTIFDQTVVAVYIHTGTSGPLLHYRFSKAVLALHLPLCFLRLVLPLTPCISIWDTAVLLFVWLGIFWMPKVWSILNNDRLKLCTGIIIQKYLPNLSFLLFFFSLVERTFLHIFRLTQFQY